MAIGSFGHIKHGLKYTFLFFYQTALSVLWYAICRIAATVISWLEDILPIEGYITAYVCKALELCFLILGAVVAIVYFLVQTWDLVEEIRGTKKPKTKRRTHK